MCIRDRDGTDYTSLFIWGLGTPSDISNGEYLIIRYNPSGEMQIVSEQIGTGTLRPIVLYTEGNTDQLKLNIDGTVSLGGNLDVNDEMIKFDRGQIRGNYSSSPKRGLVYEAIGNTGGWYGTHWFTTSYNTGTVGNVRAEITQNSAGDGRFYLYNDAGTDKIQLVVDGQSSITSVSDAPLRIASSDSYGGIKISDSSDDVYVSTASNLMYLGFDFTAGGNNVVINPSGDIYPATAEGGKSGINANPWLESFAWTRSASAIDNSGTAGWYKLGTLTTAGASVIIRIIGGDDYGTGNGSAIVITGIFGVGNAAGEIDGHYWVNGAVNDSNKFGYVQTGDFSFDIYAYTGAYFRGTFQIYEGYSWTTNTTIDTKLTDPSMTDFTKKFWLQNDVEIVGDLTVTGSITGTFAPSGNVDMLGYYIHDSTQDLHLNDNVDISGNIEIIDGDLICLLYTSPSPRDLSTSRMPSSA